MKLFKSCALLTLVLSCVFENYAAGQSLVTGSVAGTVKDPTPGVVPDALVNLQSLDTGESQSTTTNAQGVYRFAQLKPGRYLVSVAVTGFAKMVSDCTVEVGHTTTLDMNLKVSKRIDTIEVSAEAPLINGDPGTVTNFTPTEVALLPAAGGDITTIAFTAPGVFVAQGSGYGNFSANGLPGTSNLFTVNGENDMDPYTNVNYAGASYLALGLNEVQEATVTTNPYSGQYGQLSGAQVSFVTKSGTNQFHGNAQWWWNGRYLNSNNFFSNASQSPRPFSNANQWAASVGGPIFKDRTWFFVDTEGVQFVLPNVNTVTIPTSAFAAATLANIEIAQPTELQAYQAIFNIYANAAKGKTPTVLPVADTECATFSLPGWTAGSPCAQTIVTTPTSFAKEWILAGRVDQKLTSKDDLFFRFKLDYGLQPSAVDALDPAFDANSSIPAYDYQAQERHVFNTSLANVFTAALSHYAAQFTQNVTQWQSTFPYGGVTFDYAGGFSGINPYVGIFPEGRNITQYQFIDDFSWVRGNHSMKFGVNFRRYDVSDHNFFDTYPTTSFSDLTSGAGTTGLQAFANGVAKAYLQQDNVSTNVPIALWGMGIYAEDQWRVSSNLTMMGVLRFEHNSNPVCQRNCLSNFKGPFPTLATVKAGAGAGDVPYNSDINTNLHRAYMGTDAVNVSPRLAFSWSPRPDNRTLVSGGIGIFYDNVATGILFYPLSNPPGAVLFNISPLDANFGTRGILPFDKTNGGPAAFAAASAAFSVNKSFNQLSNELDPIIGFNPPLTFKSIQGTIHSPQVQEWNLKVDEQLGHSTVVSVNYVGNHSIQIPYKTAWWNAVAADSVFANVPGVNSSPAVPNYANVNTYQSGAVASYNGVTFSLREQYHSWILAHVNYTFSHALDETSNGGIFQIGDNSFLFQINPGKLRTNNYGNADYDIRHLFSADYVVSPVVRFENRIVKGLLAGWQWSGKVYMRSGLPFSVIDGRSNGISIAQGGGEILAQQNGVIPASSPCGGGNAYTNGAANFGTTACLNAAAFVNTSDPSFKGYARWPSQVRNQFRGPNCIDFDMALYKTFQIKDRITLGVGATAFNIFNHPNFNLPDNNLGDATFGQSTYMQGVPTSPYGNYLGFDSSVRVVQLSAKLNF
jgi:Carboxypeptidase regulatory-like domain